MFQTLMSVQQATMTVTQMLSASTGQEHTDVIVTLALPAMVLTAKVCKKYMSDKKNNDKICTGDMYTFNGIKNLQIKNQTMRKYDITISLRTLFLSAMPDNILHSCARK